MSDRCPNCGEPQRNGWCYTCQPIAERARTHEGGRRFNAEIPTAEPEPEPDKVNQPTEEVTS